MNSHEKTRGIKDIAARAAEIGLKLDETRPLDVTMVSIDIGSLMIVQLLAIVALELVRIGDVLETRTWDAPTDHH